MKRPADGKIAVGLAAIAPSALLAGASVRGLAFLYLRLPGAVGFYLATVATACTLAGYH